MRIQPTTVAVGRNTATKITVVLFGLPVMTKCGVTPGGGSSAGIMKRSWDEAIFTVSEDDMFFDCF